MSNIILAEIPEEIDPASIDVNAQKAAKKEWKRSAGKAKALARQAICHDVWIDQLDDVIEFNSAWVFPKDEENYSNTRKRLMRLLAGRKSIRDFKPAKGRLGIPKSSLDGARESVLNKNEDLPKWLALRMRLSNGEQLCAVGLTKRLGGGRVPFPSVIRVAADPWIRGIRSGRRKDANQLLDEIRDLCRVSCKLQGRSECDYQPLDQNCRLCKGENSFSSGTGKRLYQDFPFDGQIFYPSRLYRVKKDLKDISMDTSEDNPYKDDMKKLIQIEEKVRRLQKKDNGGLGLGEPNPYLAILVADGDHMGKALSTIKSAEEHRKFSSNLSTFASEARTIVEGNHGCMVFSGGDDVLAFLPVDTCLKAARDLHDKFGELQFSDKNKNRTRLTLSVGIAIVHSMEPLEDLLVFGRAAEQAAKNPDRNGLAVHLRTRSGGEPILIREQWKESSENGLDQRLKSWAEMHLKDELPDKAAYDLRQLAEEYRGWPEISHDLLEKDMRRLLKRKRAGQGTKDISDVDLTELMKDVKSHDDLIRRAKELVLARSIAEAKKIVQASISKEASA
ncbi:CRISPR system Cmr subunit Cmr2 [uncultured archaeon]|nr:CRISPR system Cmr subunit Cmr2 [uncultured archaeon]